jgi:hypothetical protein
MSDPNPPSPREPSDAPAGPAVPAVRKSRAHAFRERETQRRSLRNERVGVVLVVVIILLGVYVIVSARPFTPSNNPAPKPGPPITVQLGTPTIATIPCASGGSAYAERIPFLNSSQPFTTGDVNARLTEIWDGDFIPDPNVVANATPSTLCGGPPPDASSLWYVVLLAPNGTNLVTYTNAERWVSVVNGTSNLVIGNNSTFVLITYASYAGSGRGFAIVGYENGSLIHATIPL